MARQPSFEALPAQHAPAHARAYRPCGGAGGEGVDTIEATLIACLPVLRHSVRRLAGQDGEDALHNGILARLQHLPRYEATRYPLQLWMEMQVWQGAIDAYRKTRTRSLVPHDRLPRATLPRIHAVETELTLTRHLAGLPPRTQGMLCLWAQRSLVVEIAQCVALGTKRVGELLTQYAPAWRE